MSVYTSTVNTSRNVFYSVISKANTAYFFFQAEDGIRDHASSRGLGDVYNGQG